LNYRKPKSGALLVAGAADTGGRERLEELAQFVSGNSLPLVHHRNLDLGRVALQRDDDRASFVRELERIANQIVQHLLDPPRIEIDYRRLTAFFEAQIDPLLVRKNRVERHVFLDQFRNIDRRGFEFEPPRLDL
jgi:hypothetical protein